MRCRPSSVLPIDECCWRCAPRRITDEIAAEFPDLPEWKHKLLRGVRYITTATISGYQMSNAHKLTTILLWEGEKWRCHNKIAFKYDDGAWLQSAQLDVSLWNELSALAGIFVKLGSPASPQDEGWECPSWDWGSIRPLASAIIANGDCTMDTLCNFAKKESDALRIKTENKAWRGNWSLRVSASNSARARTYRHVLP